MSPDPQHRTAGPVVPDPGASGWVGWVAFGAVCMLVLGCFHVLAGLVSLTGQGESLPFQREPALDVGATTQGWLQILVGVIVAVAGVCVFAGQRWARATGVVIAAVSAVSSFAFLGEDPARWVIVVGLDLVVIWALTVHGSDIVARPGPVAPARGAAVRR